MNISAEKLLDIVERAMSAGCLPEVIKMVKSGSPLVMIEKVIEKSMQRQLEFDLDWNDLFGAD